jgi:hypothetical protein
MTFKYGRGVYVEDRVTGFRGAIVGRADYLTGCNQYLVMPPVGEDGKFVEGIWFDEMRLTVDVDRQRLVLDRDADQPPG